MQTIFQTIDKLNDAYIHFWEDVCRIESPTAYKAGVDAVGTCIKNAAKERGWDIEEMHSETAGNAFCVTINKTAPAPAVVFSGHIDTVFPLGTFSKPIVRTDDKKIYGPGVMDCKGGVVASFMAMDALDKCGFSARPVKLIVQTDEETGSKTSNKQTLAFMLDAAKNAAAFLNTEGIQGNTAVLIRKGILRYRFTVHGRATHSSKCAQGANAIVEAAHKIIALEQMKDADGLTCNGISNGLNAFLSTLTFTLKMRAIPNGTVTCTVTAPPFRR